MKKIIVLTLVGLAVMGLSFGRLAASGDADRTAPVVDDGAPLVLDQTRFLNPIVSLDICDDEEAVLAGLNGLELESDRLRLGVDCAKGESMYFTETQVFGETLITDAALTKAERETIARDELRYLEQNPVFLGIGSSSGRELVKSEGNAVSESGIVVLSESLSLSADGVLRGLVQNVSGDVSYRNVSISVKAGTPADRLQRIDLQPGETQPFEFETTLDSIPDAGEIRVRGKESLASDRGLRAFQIEVIRTVDVSDPSVDDDFSVPRDSVAVAVGRIGVAQPTNGWEVRRVKNPAVVVALLDSSGRVIEVEELKVLEFSDGGRSFRPTNTVAADDPSSGYFGFGMTSDTEEYLIWAGGRTR